MRRSRHLLGRVTPLLGLFLVALGALLGPGAARAGDPKEKALPPGVPDAAMQKAIDAAVAKGAEWLRSQQDKGSGSFGSITTSIGPKFEIGTTALVGLALLAASKGKPDPAVEKALACCRKLDEAAASVRTTYDTGVLLMLITEFHRGKEPAKGKDGKPGKRTSAREDKAEKGSRACPMPEDVRTWVLALVDHLVASRKDAGTWGYPMYDDDHSNTQYAFLGLRAARDCGATIRDEVFEKAIVTMLDRQEKDGPKVLRHVPSAGAGYGATSVDSGDRARGWKYREPFSVTGSMTTAAVAVLAISHDALTRPTRSPRYTPQMERDVQRAVQDGFSWIDRAWTVDRNPGESAVNWHLYYLYGLERAAVFGGRDLIGVHDWYLEGAAKLLSMQSADGRWTTGWPGIKDYQPSDLCDTAWAILFLERATRPFPPIRAPVITPGTPETPGN